MQQISTRFRYKHRKAFENIEKFFEGLFTVLFGLIKGSLILAVGAAVIIVGGLFVFSAGDAVWETIYPTPPEEKAWGAVWRGSNEDNIRNLLSFADQYPSGKHKSDVPVRLEQLAWEIAKAEAQTPFAWPHTQPCYTASNLARHTYGPEEYRHFFYSDYLRAFPSGPHAEYAALELEDFCWEYAKRSDSDKDYTPASAHLLYLEAYPDGRWKTFARSYVSDLLYDRGLAEWNREYLQRALVYMPDDDSRRARAKAAMEEMDSWAKAVQADTFEAFQQHLNAWPTGHDHSLASWMMEYHGTWDALPFDDKALGILDQKFRDLVEPQDTTLELHDGERMEKCLADRDFVDLINGYVLASRYHDDYRRRFFFGFDAPYADRAKSGTIAILSTLEPEKMKQIVLAAWKKVVLSADQRRQLKRLAVVALEHERIFDSAYTDTEAKILEKRYPAEVPFESWHELQGFKALGNPCYEVGFDAFPTGITPTLWDFWYTRLQEGTKKAASAAFQAIADAENPGQP